MFQASVPILLIDRDGVINQKPQTRYLESWEAFQFVPETLEGMRLLATQGWFFIVITNQAGIERGWVKAEAVERIHREMVKSLQQQGICVLEVYHCPHWEAPCECRKPRPGMFFRAAQAWGFSLEETLYIGDDPRDCEAAFRAGTQALYVGEPQALEALPLSLRPRWTYLNLLEALKSGEVFPPQAPQGWLPPRPPMAKD